MYMHLFRSSLIIIDEDKGWEGRTDNFLGDASNRYCKEIKYLIKLG